MVFAISPFVGFSPIRSTTARPDVAPAAAVPPLAGPRDPGTNAPNLGIAPDTGRTLIGAQAERSGFGAVLSQEIAQAAARTAARPPFAGVRPESGGSAGAYETAPSADPPRLIGYSALSAASDAAAPSGQMVSLLA